MTSSEKTLEGNCLSLVHSWRLFILLILVKSFIWEETSYLTFRMLGGSWGATWIPYFTEEKLCPQYSVTLVGKKILSIKYDNLLEFVTHQQQQWKTKVI